MFKEILLNLSAEWTGAAGSKLNQQAESMGCADSDPSVILPC